MKIDLQKQTNKQKFKTQKKNPNKQNPDYWKNYYSWQVYISYQPVQESSTTEVHKIKTQASILHYLEIHNILATVHGYNYNFACWQNLYDKNYIHTSLQN